MKMTALNISSADTNLININSASIGIAIISKY